MTKEILSAADQVAAGVKPSEEAVRTAYSRIDKKILPASSMPPRRRIPGRRALAVLRVDLVRWYANLAPVDGVKRGASSKAERAAAKAAGLSVKEFRQRQTGVEG